MVKLLLENLPSSLAVRSSELAQGLVAIGRAGTIQAVYLFGSHARGDARADSDVDLCVVADDADPQLAAAARWSKAMRGVWPRPAFSLVPIPPARLAEKQARHDHFFTSIINEGVLIATEN